MQDTLSILVPIIVAHIVVLAIIIIVIKKLLLNDTMRAVNRVRQVEAEIRKKEDRIRKDIEEQEKEFTRRKAQAEEELQQQQDEAKQEAARLRDQTTAEARKEGERIIEQAKKNEEKMKAQIAQEMEEKAVDYGGQIFQLVFSEQMTESLDKQFIGELLDALEEVDAAAITVDASSAEFTAAHPIDPEQKQRLESLLSQKFGVDMKVEEKVDASLVAGLILKLGSLEIDGSLVNRFREAAEEVKKSAKE
jgi:F0F1-type ATP synthase delta subunit